MRCLPIIAVSFVAWLSSGCSVPPPIDIVSDDELASWDLLYQQDFSSAELSQFSVSDESAWRLQEHDGNRCLALTSKAAYKPPVRSPLAIALIGSLQFGDFLLEADLLQTGRDYGHRDMCLFFGFEGRDSFYYVHMATAADDHAHNMFRVAGKPRIKFASETTKGIEWGDGEWHKVRILRRIATGEVVVWFDDMETPIMRGEDRSFGFGQIGFGSFDDTGLVDNIRIWGPEARPVDGVRFR